MSHTRNFDQAPLLDALDQELRSRPYGSIRALERGIGKGKGWWQDRVRTGDLSVSQLFAVLDFLGLHPIGFLRNHVGREDGLELNRPQGPVPPMVKLALERAQQAREAHGLGEKVLDALDEQRYEDPQGVANSAEWAIDQIELALLPRFLGIIGSAHRLLLKVDDAEHYLYAAVEACKLHGDDVCLGNLLRRYSYIYLERADYARSLHLAERGTLLLLRAGDLEGVGKGTVEQGIRLYYLARHAEALASLQVALGLLPSGLARYRFAALQVLGLASQSSGRSEQALTFLRLAEAESQALGSREQNKAKWLKARLLENSGRLDEAAEEFAALAEAFRKEHLGNMILVNCELVRVSLRRGLRTEAITRTKSMIPVLEQLHSHRVVCDAVGTLLREEYDGLTIDLICEVIQIIEAAQRADRTGWARLKVVI